RLGRDGEAVGDPDARRDEDAYQLAERGVLAADLGQARQVDVTKGDDETWGDHVFLTCSPRRTAGHEGRRRDSGRRLLSRRRSAPRGPCQARPEPPPGP